MHLIPAIIPYFKAPAALEQNKVVLAGQEGVRVELFVRDNSVDNILFTKAVNEGLRKFCFDNQHQYVLVLNQDAFLKSDALVQMLRVMQAHPRCGICTPIAMDARGQINWCGGLDAYPWGVHRVSLPADATDTTALPSHWANGACMLLRVAMVKEIGLLDENMQFICSDSDYSFTARSRGWEILVATKAIVEHTLSTSAQTSSQWLNAVKLKDQLYFAHKWLSGGVYKSLAYEGDQLTRMRVSDHIRQTQMKLNSIAEQPIK